MINKQAGLSLSRQCQLLALSRSSVYYQPAAVSDENLAIMKAIDQLHLERPYLGSRAMVDRLKDKGFHVNRKRVRRLMRLMGIETIYPKPKTLPGNKAHTIYPYLLQDLTVEKLNQVWVTDITYVPMRRGFCYLVAIMDLFSRKILTWRLSNTLDKQFCLEALNEALQRYPSPEIFNSDQGAQFSSNDFAAILKQHDVQISMDGKGRWIDNVVINTLEAKERPGRPDSFGAGAGSGYD